MTHRFASTLHRSGFRAPSALAFAVVSMALAAPGCAVDTGEDVGASSSALVSIRDSGLRDVEYLGNYPSYAETGWNRQAQGVASTDTHWFFTQERRITKVPMTQDLGEHVGRSTPGVLESFRLGEEGTPPELRGYDHFGDADVANGRLYVPVEGKAPRLIAVFRASTLDFIDAYPVDQTKAGWCAVHPVTGQLWSSNNRIDEDNPIFVYDVLPDGLRRAGIVTLRSASGGIQTIPRYMQGGDFSEDGSTLFLSNGKASSFGPRDGGLWAFEVNSGRFLMRSVQEGRFEYEYRIRQEAEGITVQDLSGKGVPGIPEGDLHAILWSQLRNRIWFKHYAVDDPIVPLDADLRVVGLNAFAGFSPTLEASLRLRNQGDRPSGTWSGTLSLVPEGGSRRHPARTWTIDGESVPGQSDVAFHDEVPLRGVAPGRYDVHVHVPLDGDVTPADNSAVFGPITVQVSDFAGPPSELSATYVGTPRGHVADPSLPVAGKITNSGGESEPFAYRLIATRDPAHPLGRGHVVLTRATHPGLLAGRSHDFFHQIDASRLAAGQWHIALEVLPPSADDHDGNDVATGAFPFTRPYTLGFIHEAAGFRP